MSPQEAAEVVLRLASMLDQTNWKIEAPSSGYERTRTLRALYEAVIALEAIARNTPDSEYGDLDRLRAAFAAGQLWERSIRNPE